MPLSSNLLKKNFKVSEGDKEEKIGELLRKRIQVLDKRLMTSIPVLFKLLSVDKGAETLESEDPERTKI